MEQSTAKFAEHISKLGFTVYIANPKIGLSRGDYGFITDSTESRVLSFQTHDGKLSGNYGPPSTASGTGWVMEKHTWDLQTAEDVRSALYEQPTVKQCGNGWEYFSTVSQYVKGYQESSRYEKYQYRPVESVLPENFPALADNFFLGKPVPLELEKK